MNEPIASAKTKPVVLCILDGWGESLESDNNAIVQAHTPVWDRLSISCPRAQLNASESEVGLPDGQMGNSEVGHMNLGAGRVVLQDLPRIDAAFKDGSFAANSAFQLMVESLRKTGGTCHILGLLSPGGVHSHQSHIFNICRLLSDEQIPVSIHAFLDGRDTPPKSALDYMEKFSCYIASLEKVSIATVMGRYYSMDRDERWDRVEKAYSAICDGIGETFINGMAAIVAGYELGFSDEFVQPSIIAGYNGIADGDGIFMANFRADRVRQMLSAIVEPYFVSFSRARQLSLSARLGIVEYSKDLNQFIDAMFPSQTLNNTLGEVASREGLRQLRIAETEKYAHVTFFFNGGHESKYNGEDRILIPSPKVATYDLCPEMSAMEITNKLVSVIEDNTYDLIVANFANADMLGHTGILDAAIKAAETLDKCLGRLESAIVSSGGTMLVTADHGNCENMVDELGDAHTQHTLNIVPILLVNSPEGIDELRNGRLSDVAPTVLDLLGIERPSDMTGRTLIVGVAEQNAAVE